MLDSIASIDKQPSRACAKSGSAGKSEIGRSDRCFKLPRPAILLPKIRLCSEVFDFPRTSGITASYREPSNNDDIRDNIQLSRKRQRAVAGKPNNDPSWSSPHVECTTTVSQRTFYRNVKRPNRATSGNAAVRLQPVRLHPLAK